MSDPAHLLAHAPAELTSGRLRRLGEGVGKVVYCSEHWVVKRERRPADIIALIAIWKGMRFLARILPGRFIEPLLQRPSKRIRFLRVMFRPVVTLIPRSFWLATHIGGMWRSYHRRSVRGERLAREHLAGTSLIPERVAFPPVRVRVGGWPGWLTVSEATERVECTLHKRLADLAAAGDFDQLELWLDRFLNLRQSGWQRGLFSVDAHLKNFGVTGERVVLLDTGGLTDRWPEIERRLSAQQDVAEPHLRLGLGPLLLGHPDIARRFNDRWNRIVSREGVLRHWPGERGSH
ncbi:MAG: hypothetical protein ACE141_10610 [Bryobacteraceae bacterium]